MQRLFYVPIEPLVERYTESWYRNIPIAFRDAGYDVVTIDGVALENEVKVGTFLDINSTVHYKSVQLQRIAELFHSGRVPAGSVFFFGDVEFWGVESVRLLSQMNNVPIKLTGFLHAASYTEGDAFAVAAPYQRFTEVGWIAAFDLVFVGSEYHKLAVTERRLRPARMLELADRIHVTGNPLFRDDYPKLDVLRNAAQVILPNRFDAEKNPGASLRIAERVKEAVPESRIVITTGRSTFRGTDSTAIAYAEKLRDAGTIEILAGLSKSDYHSELARSSVILSTSPEENYGYCIAEALIHGCKPVLANCASHPEFPAFLFDTEDDAVDDIIALIGDDSDVCEPWQLPERMWSGMKNIADLIGSIP